MLVDQVERQQRMAQMIEHAHEQHEVEALAQRGDVVDRQLAELDVEPDHLGGEPRLRADNPHRYRSRARAPRRAASSRSSRNRRCSRCRAPSCRSDRPGAHGRTGATSRSGSRPGNARARSHPAEIDVVEPRARARAPARRISSSDEPGSLVAASGACRPRAAASQRACAAPRRPLEQAHRLAIAVQRADIDVARSRRAPPPPRRPRRARR